MFCIQVLNTDYVTRLLCKCNVHKILVQPSHREELHVFKRQYKQHGEIINACEFFLRNIPSGFGGLDVARWPLVPKFAGSNPAEAVGFLRVNKNPQHVGVAWTFVCCDCCVLLGRRLCDELITRSEESYRLWCVVVCDLETS
jgi:hypothetical protein